MGFGMDVDGSAEQDDFVGVVCGHIMDWTLNSCSGGCVVCEWMVECALIMAAVGDGACVQT